MNFIKKFSIKVLGIGMISVFLVLTYSMSRIVTKQIVGNYTVYNQKKEVIKAGQLEKEKEKGYTCKGITIYPNTWIVFCYSGTKNGGFPIQNGENANISYTLNKIAKHTVRISHITYEDYSYCQKTNQISYRPEDSPIHEPTYAFALRNDSSVPLYLEHFTIEK